MKKIKLLLISISIIIAGTTCFAQSSSIKNENLYKINFFEKLCKKTMTNNISLQIAQNENLLEKKKKNSIWIYYLPTISASTGLTYSVENEFDYKDYDSFFYSGTFNQNLPGNGLFSIESQYTTLLNKDKKSKDVDNLQIDFTYSQSLSPFYFNLKAKEPITYAEKIMYKQADLNYKITKYQVLDSLLNNYIQYRKIIRTIEHTQNKIDLYKKVSKSNRDLQLAGKTNLINYYEAQSLLNDLENYMQTLSVDKNDLKNKLKNTCGLFANPDTSFEMIFENNEYILNDDWYECFIKSFSEFSFIQKTKYDEESLFLNKENITNEYIKTKQELSPSLILQGTAIHNDKTKHNFECSVGLDLSSLFYPQKYTYKNEYKNNLYSNNLELLNLKNQNKQIYENLLNTYYDLKKEYLIKLEENNNLEELYKAAKLTYKIGNMSEIEFLQHKLLYEESEINLQFKFDLIKYYQILLNIKNE